MHTFLLEGLYHKMTSIKLKIEHSFKDQVSNTKQILKLLNATKINTKKDIINGNHDGSNIFAEINGKWFYFSISQFTFNSGITKGRLMWRTAQNEKDFKGGNNNWCTTESLQRQLELSLSR